MYIKIENYTKVLKHNTILHNVNLEFNSGNIYMELLEVTEVGKACCCVALQELYMQQRAA